MKPFSLRSSAFKLFSVCVRQRPEPLARVRFTLLMFDAAHMCHVSHVTCHMCVYVVTDVLSHSHYNILSQELKTWALAYIILCLHRKHMLFVCMPALLAIHRIRSVSLRASLTVENCCRQSSHWRCIES